MVSYNVQESSQGAEAGEKDQLPNKQSGETLSEVICP